jgi:hypothetical protein
MRLCFYNPHTGLFAKGVFHVLFRKPYQAKYEFLLAYVRDARYQTALVVDGTVSSFPLEYLLGTGLLYRGVVAVLSRIEVVVWCLIHTINPFRQTFVWRTRALNPASDILYGMAMVGSPFAMRDLTPFSLASLFSGRKLFNLSHYFTKTAHTAANLQRAGLHYFTAEAAVKDAPFFARFFPFMQTCYILPFVLRPRYQARTPFMQRTPTCLAIGTTHHLTINDYTRDYCTFFNTTNYHRMRRAIYDQRAQLADIMDIYIYPWEEAGAPQASWYQRTAGYQYLYKLVHKEQASYWKFDIVQTYNAHAFFVSPEEDAGVPSINFIEGMACGCLYIGLRHAMYAELGLRDGEHYVGYDGTLANLRAVIEWCRAHMPKCARIAHNGLRLVQQRFTPDLVLATFWRDLDHWVTDGTLSCSFRAAPAAVHPPALNIPELS